MRPLTKRALPAVFLLALLAAGSPAQPGGPDPLRPFQVVAPARLLELAEKHGAAFHEVKPGDVVGRVVERGSVEALDCADVVCNLRARDKEARDKDRSFVSTIRWVVDDGAAVKKGEKLVELDDAALRERVKAQRLRTEQAKADLTRAREGARTAKNRGELDVRLAEIDQQLAALELKRSKGTEPEEKAALTLKAERAAVLVERAREQARANEAEAEASLRAKKAAHDAAAERLRELEEELAGCVIVAPRDGLVVYHVAEQSRFGGGPLVAAGEPVREGQKLLRVCGLEKMGVLTRVHEAAVARVRPGQRALVRVDAFPGKALAAEVKHVSPVAAQADFLRSDVKVYPVRLEITEQAPRLKPGMSAEVTVTTAQKANVLAVPLQAVVAIGRDRVCFVKTGKELVARRIVTGLSSESLVEVAEGLKDGEEVLRDPRGLARKLGGAPEPPKNKGAGPLRLAPTDIVVRSVPPPENEARRAFVRAYGLTYQDLEAFRQVPAVTRAVPVRTFPMDARRRERLAPARVVASTGQLAEVLDLKPEAGRFLTDTDDGEMRNVVVLGAALAEALFEGEDPLGQSVSLDRHPYVVVGTLPEKAGGGPVGELDDCALVPLRTARARVGERVYVRTAGTRRAEEVSLSCVFLSVAQVDQVRPTADEVRRLLGKAHDQPDWAVDVPPLLK